MTPERPSSGKSVGDVLHGIITDWRTLARFALAVALVATTVIVSVAVTTALLGSVGLEASELELSDSPRLVFKRETNKQGDYFLVVQPIGWHNSTIPVEEGDKIEIHAEGRVMLSMQQLVDFRNVRRGLEETANKATGRTREQARVDTSYVPERHFPPAASDTLRKTLNRSWIGPEGYSGASGTIDQSYAGRTKYKILPRAPFGALVAAVHAGRRPPTRADSFSNAFVVGDSILQRWKGSDGTLWFIVNDVLDEDDTVFPDKFFIDNLGVFLVRVRVTRR